MKTIRSILVDTGPLYALAVKSDQYHLRSHREAAKLREANLKLITCYPIVFETFTLLQRRFHHSVSKLWLNATLGELELLSPTNYDYQQAFEKVNTYKDQDLSLFDALLASLSESFDLPIWTFDSDFDVLKATVWR